MAAVIGALRVILGLNSAEFEQGLKSASQSMQNMGKGLQNLGGKFTGYLTAPLAAFGALTVKTAGDFEASLNRLNAATSATAGEMSAMRDMAVRLGSETSKSASESADAMEMLARNGLSAGQILGGAAEASIRLSEATGGDLSQAADVATNAMAQFGLEAGDLSKVVDSITGVTLQSQFGFEEYALALGQAGGVAGALGLDIEDFNTAIAATASVFSSGSDAGTSFKNFLTRLTPASKQAAEAMAALDISFFNADGSMREIGAIAEELSSKMGGLSDEALTIAMKDIFGLDGMRTAIALMDQGASGVAAFQAKIAEASATDQAAARMQGFNGEIEKLSGAFESLQLAIAQSGLLQTITDLVAFVADMVVKLSELNPEMLKWGTIIAGVGVAIGPVLISLGLLTTAFAAISAPVTLTIAAVAALGVGLVALIANFDQVKAAVLGFTTYIVEQFQALPARLLEIGGQIIQGLADGINAKWEEVKAGIADIPNNIANSFTGFFQIKSPSRLMQGIGSFIMEGLGNGMKSMEGDVVGVADGMAASVGGAFMSIIDGSKSVGEALSGLFKSIGTQFLQSGISGLSGMGGGLGFLGKMIGGMFGFRSGGSFQVGGSGGVDSQLVAFKASPNERVSITKPGQELSGGGSISVDVQVGVENGNLVPLVTQVSGQVAGRQISQNNKQLPGMLREINQRTG